MNTKNLFFTLLLITGISQSLVAQTFNYVTETEYNSLKMNGQLTGNEVIQSEGMVTVDPSGHVVKEQIDEIGKIVSNLDRKKIRFR